VGSMIQSSGVAYGVIHHAEHFPVIATACGTLGPSSHLWMFTTCIPCLRKAAADPRIQKRLDQMLAEEEAKMRGDGL
jgi:hypothetical protein